MKEILITRDSRLYKLVALLSTLPIFSSFIVRSRYSGYSSFTDVCTFCRHLIYSLLTILLYVIVFSLVVGLFIVEPLRYFFGSATLYGQATVIGFTLTIGLYIVLLAIQQGIQPLVGFYTKLRFSKEKQEVEKESALKHIAQIVSQKHSSFCKRITVEPKQDRREE